jgi:hypothetical protein
MAMNGRSTDRRAIAERLRALGFERDGLGHCHRGNDLGAWIRPGWLTLKSDCAAADGASPAGLWKPARPGPGRDHVLDLPWAALEGDGGHDDDTNDGGACVLSGLIDWAVCTRGGAIPPEWSAPDPQETLDLLPCERRSLSFRAGDIMEQARLDCAGPVLALRVTLARLDGDLSQHRRLWLMRAIGDAARLRMVRVALVETDERRCIEAAVDLSGVPAAALGPLLRAGEAALAHAYSWLSSTLVLLADGRCASAALEALEPAPSLEHP